MLAYFVPIILEFNLQVTIYVFLNSTTLPVLRVTGVNFPSIANNLMVSDASPFVQNRECLDHLDVERDDPFHHSFIPLDWQFHHSRMSDAIPMS